MLWKQGRPGSAAFATPQIALAPLSPSRRGRRASRAESRGVALWRAKCPGSGGPGRLHPAGSVQDRLPGCHRGGVRRLPCLHRQPRSTAGCRFKIETLGKSDTIPRYHRQGPGAPPLAARGRTGLAAMAELALSSRRQAGGAVSGVSTTLSPAGPGPLSLRVASRSEARYLKNRMRQSRTSGSVGDRVGNHPGLPGNHEFPFHYGLGRSKQKTDISRPDPFSLHLYLSWCASKTNQYGKWEKEPSRFLIEMTDMET